MNRSSIVSLVPSLTELLFDLGLEAQVKGRTRFCIHPKEKVKSVPIVGGTKTPDLEKIRQINPNLIIANREENRKEHIEELQKEFEVILTEISTIEEALFEIHEIGKKCGVSESAEKLIFDIQQEMNRAPDVNPLTAAYLIWRKPWMSVGHDTYIHSVMEHWKLKNVYEEKVRYPTITLEALSLKKPRLILLSSEPYPFKEKHIAEVSEICSGSDIMLVNGEWFSWYGSRMLQAFRQLNAVRRTMGL